MARPSTALLRARGKIADLEEELRARRGDSLRTYDGMFQALEKARGALRFYANLDKKQPVYSALGKIAKETLVAIDPYFESNKG